MAKPSVTSNTISTSSSPSDSIPDPQTSSTLVTSTSLVKPCVRNSQLPRHKRKKSSSSSSCGDQSDISEKHVTRSSRDKIDNRDSVNDDIIKNVNSVDESVSRTEDIANSNVKNVGESFTSSQNCANKNSSISSENFVSKSTSDVSSTNVCDKVTENSHQCNESQARTPHLTAECQGHRRKRKSKFVNYNNSFLVKRSHTFRGRFH